MKYTVIYPEISDCLNRYRCVVNGNEIIAIDNNKKHGFYTELWYTFENGKSLLVNFWN